MALGAATTITLDGRMYLLMWQVTPDSREHILTIINSDPRPRRGRGAKETN